MFLHSANAGASYIKYIRLDIAFKGFIGFCKWVRIEAENKDTFHMAPSMVYVASLVAAFEVRATIYYMPLNELVFVGQGTAHYLHNVLLCSPIIVA